MVIRNYAVKGLTTTIAEEVVGQDVEVCIGSTNYTIVKSLEISTSDTASIVFIKRANESGTVYATIKVDMVEYNYVTLWDSASFVVLPSGHKLIINADNDSVQVVANVVEM